MLDALYSIATLGPAVLLGLAAVVLAAWFPLNRRRVIANSVARAERREG